MVSLNTITYPDNIKCECGKNVNVNIYTIDSSTWNLRCKCGKIAYIHPKSNERIEQINSMLD